MGDIDRRSFIKRMGALFAIGVGTVAVKKFPTEEDIKELMPPEPTPPPMYPYVHNMWGGY